MTEVVDEITVKVTLRHCLSDLSISPLRNKLVHYWPTIAGLVSIACTEGKKEFEDGLIVVEWQNTGLHEIPETTGGDN